MPLYEYYCTECATPFEVLRPMSQSDNAAACPHCANHSAHRLISLFAAVSRDSNGGSRLVASSQAGGGGCAGCGGGHCGNCGH